MWAAEARLAATGALGKQGVRVAGRIRDEDIALVREQSPIADVVGDYLQLRNAGGGSLKGLCPFHDEKTPSFNVTPARGLWYCFSCADGGDIIKFVEKVDNLSFPEAVERLAARAGIELTYEQGGRSPARSTASAVGCWPRIRPPPSSMRNGCTPRPLPRRAPFSRNEGSSWPTRNGSAPGMPPRSGKRSPGTCAAVGSPTPSCCFPGWPARDGAGPVDRFRGRLLWPIRDLTGDVIAFGARKLDPDDNGPKYLNTPETPLFKKSSVLYGADLAKREIAHRRQAVIVEGYTDVMACHLAGVPTAVATCGTSFGDGHVKVLRRLLMDADQFRGEVVFTFDGDAAGQRAVLRAFDLEERFVTQTFVAVQADGLDPCDLRCKHGDGAVRDLVARRVPVFEFAIRSELAKHNLETNEGRLAALDAAARIIGRIKDRGLINRYAVSLDRWLGMLDEEFVRTRVWSRPRGRADRAVRRAAGPGTRRPGRAERARRARAAPAPGDGAQRRRPARRGAGGCGPGGAGQVRPCRPGDPGGAGSAQAGGPAARPVRPGVRRARPGRVHRRAACRGA